MIGENIAFATIGIVSFDNYFGADEYIERGLEEFFDDMFNGSDYYFVIDAIEGGLPKYMYISDILNDDTSVNTFTAYVRVYSSAFDDYEDDAYFSASAKIGKKRPVTSSEGAGRNTKSWMSKARDCGYSMGDLKYWFEVETGRDFDRESDGRFFTEWVTKFLSNCEDVKSCDSVMSSYNPYGTDFKWYDEPIVMYIDGENSTFRKYTGDYKGNIVVVQPEYNERTDVLSWVVYLNNRKLESFETSYDALDFAQFELVDMYITPIRSSKRVPKRKIVSAIDLRRKQDFVDAYMDAYGVTKTEAFKAFKDCVNRGDESYIDEIISGFKGNSRKSFYED